MIPSNFDRTRWLHNKLLLSLALTVIFGIGALFRGTFAQAPQPTAILKPYYNEALEKQILGLKGDEADFIKRPEHVSIIRLIANPNDYQDKPIRVVGFLKFSHENHALYLDEDSARNIITKNAVWVTTSDTSENNNENNLVNFNNKYVSMSGKFDMKFKGHSDMFSGGISNVFFVREIRTGK